MKFRFLLAKVRCAPCALHAHLLSRCRLAADTTKMYAKTYAAGKKKCFSSGAGAPEACEGPGGTPKDPLISRPGPFDKITKPVPVVTYKPPEPPKEKEEKK